MSARGNGKGWRGKGGKAGSPPTAGNHNHSICMGPASLPSQRDDQRALLSAQRVSRPRISPSTAGSRPLAACLAGGARAPPSRPQSGRSRTPLGWWGRPP